MNRLHILVCTLSSHWHGEAQVAFYQKYKSMDAIHRRFAAVLEEYADVMGTTAKQFEGTDAEMAAKFRNI